MDEKAEEVCRLGKRELGSHAFEQRMPTRISTIINGEASQNKLDGVVPILARLLERDSQITTAYLCSGETTQIYRLKGEGNHFCGYRNIQMMLSREQYSIPKLQDMIEAAWDQGYNAHGRIETGGIKDTRKHIGTSEAEALFQSLNMPCTAQVFTGKTSWNELLDSIEEYFSSRHMDWSNPGIVRQTNLSPIFLQRPCHSLTIIGIEKLHNGKRRLLTFDPAYDPPSPLFKQKKDYTKFSSRLTLWRYRRDETYLKRYRDFEVLYLDQAT